MSIWSKSLKGPLCVHLMRWNMHDQTCPRSSGKKYPLRFWRKSQNTLSVREFTVPSKGHAWNAISNKWQTCWFFKISKMTVLKFCISISYSRCGQFQKDSTIIKLRNCKISIVIKWSILSTFIELQLPQSNFSKLLRQEMSSVTLKRFVTNSARESLYSGSRHLRITCRVPIQDDWELLISYFPSVPLFSWFLSKYTR